MNPLISSDKFGKNIVVRCYFRLIKLIYSLRNIFGLHLPEFITNLKYLDKQSPAFFTLIEVKNPIR